MAFLLLFLLHLLLSSQLGRLDLIHEPILLVLSVYPQHYPFTLVRQCGLVECQTSQRVCLSTRSAHEEQGVADDSLVTHRNVEMPFVLD